MHLFVPLPFVASVTPVKWHSEAILRDINISRYHKPCRPLGLHGFVYFVSH